MGRTAKVPVVVDVTPEMKQLIDRLAIARKMERSELMRHAIRLLGALDKRKKKGDILVLRDQAGNEKLRIQNF